MPSGGTERECSAELCELCDGGADLHRAHAPRSTYFLKNRAHLLEKGVVFSVERQGTATPLLPHEIDQRLQIMLPK